MDIPSTTKTKRGTLSYVEKEKLCRANLLGASADSYGPAYKDHFFEQYKIFVESVNYTSDLKLKINTFFLTVNTALVTAIGISFSKQPMNSSIWHTILPIAGILISIIWWGVTSSYKQRNVAKLHIIHCLEEQLPLALYKTEWKLMDENYATPFQKFIFKIDLFIPYVFLFSYLLFALFD